MMTLLEVELTSWADRWYLAGISVVTVFFILIALVLVLQIFNAVAKSGSKAPKAAAAPAAAPKAQAAPLASASEEDKAAVAVALYLYMDNAHDEESGVLTIGQTHSAWHAVLNTRL